MKQKYCQTKSTQSAKTRTRITEEWFYTCEQEQIPCIRLNWTDSRANIHWDHFSYLRTMDDAFSGDNGEKLRGCVLDMFRRLAEEHRDTKMECMAARDTVDLARLPGKAAENIAAELYDIIARHCDEFTIQKNLNPT